LCCQTQVVRVLPWGLQMHIGYFSNHFAAHNAHGVARYAHSLYEALRAGHTDLELTPIATWSNRSEDDRRSLQERTNLRILPWGRKMTPLAWMFLNRPPIEHWISPPLDVVHLAAMGFPVATRKPLVVTVHDMGPFTHPEFFAMAPPWIYRRSLHQVVAQADAVICVSQATADELIRYVSQKYAQQISHRVHVVHEGVEPRFFESPDPDCLRNIGGLPDSGVPLLLTAGKISPRKNLQGVVKALAGLAQIIPHHLVAVGGDGWDMETVRDLLHDSPIADRIHLVGYVTDEQLRSLYRAASAYLHPSLFEGFGLTILEAMAAGCPVITSNVSSLPEVAGDAAVLVDPMDVDEIAEAIRSVCQDGGFASDLAERGRARARSFTWSRCAEETAAVYRAVS